MPVSIKGTGGGSVTLSAAAAATDTTLTLPNTTGTVITTGSTAVVTQAMLASNVAGNGPTFMYNQTSAQTLSSSTWTKLTFTSSIWDTTSGMYASSRFTPTVAGYYTIVGAMSAASTAGENLVAIYKNGAAFIWASDVKTGGASLLSALTYCNGSTDYIELYGYVQTGQALSISTAPYQTFFQACMVRGA